MFTGIQVGSIYWPASPDPTICDFKNVNVFDDEDVPQIFLKAFEKYFNKRVMCTVWVAGRKKMIFEVLFSKEIFALLAAVNCFLDENVVDVERERYEYVENWILHKEGGDVVLVQGLFYVFFNEKDEAERHVKIKAVKGWLGFEDEEYIQIGFDNASLVVSKRNFYENKYISERIPEDVGIG